MTDLIKRLEFSSEMFKGEDAYLEDNMYLEHFVDKANAILAEKLRGATQVWCDTKEGFGVSDASITVGGFLKKYTGFLIFVERVGDAALDSAKRLK